MKIGILGFAHSHVNAYCSQWREHDMDVVFSIAQSIMVMHQGRTLIQGKPEKVRGNKEVQEAYLGGE